MQIKKIYKDAVLIFFIPKDAKTQRERLISRKRESLEQIEERIKQAIVDAEYAKHYDYIIVNDDIEKAVKDVEDVVKGTYIKSNYENNIKILDQIIRDIKEGKNV